MTSVATPNIGLDHIGLFGQDLSILSQQYERLGFCLTPVSQHSRPAAPGEPALLRGTANRCAMLQRGYIELLAVVDPQRDTLGVPEALARYAGAHIIAFDIQDVAQARHDLNQAGLPFQDTYLERDVDTPTGSQRAKFTQIKPDASLLPEGRIFMLRHETPELVWQPHQLQHPNTALRLKDVIVAVDDLQARSEFYERYLGNPAQPGPGSQRYALADGTCFTLATAASLQEQFPGLQLAALPIPAVMVIEVDDLQSAQTVIQGNGIATTCQGQQLVVAAEHAAGITLVFEQSQGTAPRQI